jgi:hypothetical protein
VCLQSGPCAAGAQRCTKIPKALAETLGIHMRGNDVAPGSLSMTFAGDAALTFRDFDVQALRFVTEVPGPRGLVFVSTLRTGKLGLPDIGATYPLGEGAFLSLRGFRGRVSALHIADSVTIEAEGTAERVLAGPEGYARDLTPSLLEYLGHNRQVTLLWSALAFIWGLAWSARRLFAG